MTQLLFHRSSPYARIGMTSTGRTNVIGNKSILGQLPSELKAWGKPKGWNDLESIGVKRLISERVRSIFQAAGANAEYYDVEMDSGVMMYLLVLLDTREVVDEASSDRYDMNGLIRYRSFSIRSRPDEPCLYSDEKVGVVCARDDLAATLQAGNLKGVKLIKPGEDCTKWNRW